MELDKITRVNTTTIFLLPLIPLDKGVFDVVVPYKGKSTRLLNAFLYDEDVPKYKNGYITVIHSNYQDLGFKVFETKLVNNMYFEDSYDISSTYYSAKVFRIPEFCKHSYECFLSGKYSQYNLEDVINTLYFDYLGNKDIVTQVFKKEDSLRAMKEEALGVSLEGFELWSIYDDKYDVLTRDIKEFLSKKKLQPNEKFVNNET
jgi:hypothetical protein